MMSAERQPEEQQRLDKNLSQVRDKILNQWMGDDLQTYLAEHKRKHEEIRAKNKEQIEALKSSLEHLKGQAKTNEKVMQERVDTLRLMRTEFENVEQETDVVLREKEVSEGVLSETQKEVQKEKELIDAQEKVTEQRFQELVKASEWFKDRLGLQFKKTKGERLQLILTCIDPDPKRQDRPCFFNIKIESDGKYCVTDCEPAIEDLEILVEKLNTTNNFRSFVITMRQKFKTLCTADKKDCASN